MNRRDWILLASSALLPGCGAGGADGAVRNFTHAAAAVARSSGDGFGVWENGRLLRSRDLEKRLPSLSITKSLAALAVVRAVGEGLLTLDRPLVDLVPEWQDDPRKSRISVRMLVNQTAGFVSGVSQLYRAQIPDKGKVAIALPLADFPGERFRYGPASSEVLAEVMRRALLPRGSTTERLIGQLMSRIGLTSPDWRRDGAKRHYLSTGAEFSVAELGRLGQVVGSLSQGNDTAGLRAEIFRDLASPRPANPMFAAGIWWNRNAAGSGGTAIEPESELAEVRPPSFWRRACFAPDLDPEWLAMVGSGGKRVYVLPSRKLVVARLGRSLHWNDGAFLRSLSA